MRNRKIGFAVVALVAAVCGIGGAGRAQEAAAFDARASYDKAEYQVTMRDGVKLFVSIYSPKDKSLQYPILLQRTPYSVGPYGADNFRRFRAPMRTSPAKVILWPLRTCVA